MKNFSGKLNKVVENIELYLKSVFSKQSRNSYLIMPMKYSVLSGIYNLHQLYYFLIDFSIWHEIFMVVDMRKSLAVK